MRRARRAVRLGTMEQINVVISGFGPYEDVEVNPAFVVPSLLETRGFDGLQSAPDPDLAEVEISINAVRLPISFAKAWPQLRASLEAMSPQIVIATGLKRTARGVLLERCAMNLMDADKPDVDNALPDRVPIDPQGPAAYWTGLPLRAIIGDFARGGIPVSLSSDAGTYVCNSLFYNLLHWTATRQRTLAGFVNLPQITESEHSQHGLSMRQQVEACRIIVEQSVRYYLQPSSGDILLA